MHACALICIVMHTYIAYVYIYCWIYIFSCKVNRLTGYTILDMSSTDNMCHSMSACLSTCLSHCIPACLPSESLSSSVLTPLLSDRHKSPSNDSERRCNWQSYAPSKSTLPTETRRLVSRQFCRFKWDDGCHPSFRLLLLLLLHQQQQRLMADRTSHWFQLVV